MNSKSWFRIKFAILMVLAVYVGVISLPDSIKNYLPDGGLKDKLLSYQTTLGIDLSGGTSLEYKIDFTKAQARVDAVNADDDKTNDTVLDKQTISGGVVKTLKKRIDSDGTKEVGVFYSERGDDVYVVVELTSALDTAENRAKLEKVTSLSFKEPMTSAEQLSQTQGFLDTIVSNDKTFEDVQASVEASKIGEYIPSRYFTKEDLIGRYGETSAEKIWEAANNKIFPEVASAQYSTSILFPLEKKKIPGSEEGADETEVMEIKSLTFSTPWKDTGLGGAQFRIAKVSQNQQGTPVTEINFDADGAQLFADITGRLAKEKAIQCGGSGQQFAIFVDGELESDPCVSERIDGGNAIITLGASNYQEAQKRASVLAEALNSGATPAPIELVSERKISASLGESAFTDSVNAALVGFVLVAIWIIFFYRFLGFLAIVALGFYAAVFIFLLKASGLFVLTLSGVAGMILSIGMAVDANVLIFERIREELKGGLPFKDAIQEGFDRAWTSIRDSNTSSLITSFILYALGTSIIKSFAITLSVGIIISMFTAIVFTRYLILAVTPKSLQENKSFLVGGK